MVRDDFYADPSAIRNVAQTMSYSESLDAVGYRTDGVYHERGMRRRLEQVLGIKITRWDKHPDDGNGTFYCAFSRGGHKEIPGVHSDGIGDITVLIYLTPDLPPAYGTSFWQHRSTGLTNEPTRADARRLNTTLTKLHNRLVQDSENRQRWIEIDRVGHRYNRMVAYASDTLHSASRHFGSDLKAGRIYQTYRIGVDWSRFRLGK